MYLYILRHGTTEWNMQHLIQGQTDIPLDDFGKLMASETKKGLDQKRISFDRTYSSPLKRALETAQLVSDNECITDDRLKELSFGYMDGGKVEQMTADETCPFSFFKSAPDKYEEAILNLRHISDEDMPEKLSNLCDRAKSFLTQKIEPLADSGENILISTHGALSKALLMHIRGEKDLSEFWGDGLLPNCGFAIIKLSKNGDAIKYEIINDSVTFYNEEIKKQAPKLL